MTHVINLDILLRPLKLVSVLVVRLAFGGIQLDIFIPLGGVRGLRFEGHKLVHKSSSVFLIFIFN